MVSGTGTWGQGGCGEYFLQKITKIAKGGCFTDVAFFCIDFGFFREVHVAVLNSDFTPSRIRGLKTEDPGMDAHQTGGFSPQDTERTEVEIWNRSL